MIRYQSFFCVMKSDDDSVQYVFLLHVNPLDAYFTSYLGRFKSFSGHFIQF